MKRVAKNKYGFSINDLLLFPLSHGQFYKLLMLTGGLTQSE